MGHPGGMLTAPQPPPVVTPTGMTQGVAPGQGMAQPHSEATLDLFGIKSPLSEFDPQDIAVPWSNFQKLVSTIGQFNLEGKDLTEAQKIAARHVRRPRNAAELDELGQDYQSLLGIVSGKSIQERAQRIKDEKQWRDEAKTPGSADYLIQQSDLFRKEWGANPLATGDDFKAMRKAQEAGNTERANRIATQVTLRLKGGLDEKTMTGRMGMLLQLAGKAGVGSLTGHEWLALAQRLMPGVFSEADAGNMIGLLQGAAAEKGRNLLLGQFKNWESIPPGERSNVIARMNGMGKILGEKPIQVDAKWERQLTPQQRQQLAQGQARIELQGEAVDLQRASLEWRNWFQEHPGPGKGKQRQDEILRQLIREENQARENAKAAMKPTKAQPGVSQYLEWRADPANRNPDGSVKIPAKSQEGITGSDVPRKLWRLEEAQKAASNAVIDHIKRSAKQRGEPAPPGGGGGTSITEQRPAGGANKVMMRGPSNNLVDVTPILREALRQKWTNERTQQFLRSQGYRP